MILDRSCCFRPISRTMKHARISVEVWNKWLVTNSEEFELVRVSRWLGCYATATDDPMASSMMVTPSIFHLNFSPRKIGERMAVKMIVKLVVPLMRRMLPILSATDLKMVTKFKY